MSPCCPRCGGTLRPPDLVRAEWRCDRCGPVPPLHIAARVSAEVLAAIRDRIHRAQTSLPMWCLWPLPAGWLVSGAAWAGDERCGPKATAVALTGPSPLGEGPADLVLVAEEPGVGLGARLAGISGLDPGTVTRGTPVRVRAGGHHIPLWAVASRTDCGAYVGEAHGIWLYAVTWPERAGYLFAEDDLPLHDLADSLPGELVFGAPSPRLRPPAGEE